VAEYAAGDPAVVKDAVKSEVCRLGGDVVVTEVNAHGHDVRGIILRKAAP
jgi:hypothetical protein